MVNRILRKNSLSHSTFEYLDFYLYVALQALKITFVKPRALVLVSIARCSNFCESSFFSRYCYFVITQFVYSIYLFFLLKEKYEIIFGISIKFKGVCFLDILLISIPAIKKVGVLFIAFLSLYIKNNIISYYKCKIYQTDIILFVSDCSLSVCFVFFSRRN